MIDQSVLDDGGGGEPAPTYADYVKVLTDWRFRVSEDRIELLASGPIIPQQDLDTFEELWEELFDGHAPTLVSVEVTQELINAVDTLLAPRLGVAVAGIGGGKLHKSLHKGLHKSLHKGLHKSLHKAVLGGAASYSASSMAWPEIEVPWREIKRLFDRKDKYAWHKHRLPDHRPGHVLDGAPPEIDQFAAELAVLHLMQDDLRRPDSAWRRERIQIEAGNDLTAYMLPLGADAASPAGHTAVMFQIILWLGSLIGQIYKARYNTPRPNVLDPTLEPYIPVPVYSSFPSNHAFQSFLIAEVFSRMVPEHPGASSLFHAAWEVAINREYAGLHYRSDTLAGMELARLSAPAIEEVLKDHRRGVRAEWLGESTEGGQ
ncbi:phosphatase PAP2 family protein [Meridianimarinicoccus sp. MJW13]|uniref:phosphatase PAP2 family protein n=1 Tax=Meridianimarinicoccus sp. MJW13 TaxID=2720031 RepID=UPI001865B9E6|nr:phosphatase PAP2 family protein [Fluviibacterium sp. MJW13]